MSETATGRLPEQSSGADEIAEAAPAETTAADVREPVTHREARTDNRWRRPGWPTVAGYVVALVPVVLMLHRVHVAPPMPYTDYWNSLLRITRPDGSLHWRGLLTYQNEHPFVVPNTLYYLFARFLHGTNQVMGYYSVIVAVLGTLVLSRLLPARWPSVARAWFTVVISALLLLPAGEWNFVRGMSGTAWLTANLFALLAIWFAVRRWTIPATVAAGFALISYGTGFGAPIAIIAVALLLGQRWWRWSLPAALFVVAAIIYKLTAPPGSTGTGVSTDPTLLGSTFLSNLGIVWDSSGGSLGRIMGAAGLLALVLCLRAVWSRRSEFADLTAWWALAVYAIVAGGLISLARSEVFEGDGSQGRYVSLSALFWLAVLVIGIRVLLATRPVSVRVIVAVAAVVITWTAGSNLMTQATSLDGAQRALAAAIRVGATNDPYAGFIAQPDQQIPRLRALHDYPFTDSFNYGCGGIGPGDTISGTVRTLTVAGSDYGDLDTVQTLGNAHRASGWVFRPDHPVSCVLMVADGNRVVGGGTWKINRQDVKDQHPTFPLAVGFAAVAPSSVPDVKLVLGFDDGYFTLPRSPAAATSGQ